MQYTINTKNRKKITLRYFQKLKDTNPKGETICCNNFYIEKDSKPMFFNSAEFHYFRTPCEYWEEEILKLKASGINMISSTVAWIMHEEKEGIFNFQNSLNIRKFIELCKKHDMYFCLRIGPYIHAELINGGLPQWLMSKPIKVRSNDEGYLFYAKRYLDKLLNEVKGLFYNEGGSIVAIYLENELDEGPEHLEFLKQYVINSGCNAPIYFFTSMPNEFVWYEEAIPTGGAYPFPTWGNEMTAMASSGNYLFTNSWKIYHDGFEAYSIDNKTPYALTEIGSGIMTSNTLRPLVPPNAIPALSAVKIANGCNYINYFMYHGGINPHTDEPYYFGDSISPDMSYDFQAPISEFGQMREMNKHIKVISHFLGSFGSDIAPLNVCLQDNNDEIVENNITDLRYAARSNGKKGYLFINNYQDHLVPTDKTDLQFNIVLDNETISFPKHKPLNVLSEDYAILPFNMQIGNVLIKYATAQPVTMFNNEDITYLIMTAPFGAEYTEYCLDESTFAKIEIDDKICSKYDNSVITTKVKGNNSIKVTSKSGEILIIKTISKEDALNLWKVKINGNNHVVISPLQLTDNENNIKVICEKSGNYKFQVFPSIDSQLMINDTTLKSALQDEFSEFNLEFIIPDVKEMKCSISNDSAVIKVGKDNLYEQFKELFIEVDYQGDIARAFINDKLILDNYYHNEKWQIGLKRYFDELNDKELYIKIYDKPNEKGKSKINSIRCFGTVETIIDILQ